MKPFTPLTLSQFAKAQRQSSMPKPNRKLLAALEDFGRERLSKHFFMRDFLYSEVSATHGIPNVPDDAKLAVRAGNGLCENLLEPLRCIFGHVVIRSAFRSAVVNGYCHKHKMGCSEQRGKLRQTHLGSSRRQGAHRRHGLHRHPLVHRLRSIQEEARLAPVGLVHSRQTAVLADGLFFGKRRLQSHVARQIAGTLYPQQIRSRASSPHKTRNGQP